MKYIGSPHKQLVFRVVVLMGMLFVTDAGNALETDGARVAGYLKVDGIYFSNDATKTLITKPSDIPNPWTILGSDIYYLSGNVGIGTMTPGQKFSVAGTIESTAGGFKFPDGTTQTTASAGGGVTLTSPDSSITVGGTASAPTVGVNFTQTDTRYAPASGSANYVARSGDTMTGSLTLPANGLQMAGGQIVTSGGKLGYGDAPKAEAYFDIAGTFTAPTYTAHLLQVDGTLKSNGGYAQAYLRGISVSPTYDLSAGYANYLVGIEADVRNKTGGSVAHSVVGFNLNGQPTSGQECSVGFGIGVPNQQPSLCNGKYGFYQGDTNAQYNYFASKVGIGTPFPTQALTVQGNVQVNGTQSVAGTIESTSGGFKFPDGTTQTTASTGGGVTVTSPDSSITVGGTASAPTVGVNFTQTDTRYAPASGSANYVAKSGDTMTGSLTLPANGLQMAGGQIATSGGNLGYGTAAKNGVLFDIGGSVTVPAPASWGAHLLQLDGTTKSNAYGQAYLKGLYVAPTFDVSAGYANYLTGIETYMGYKTGSNVAHSVVGYHLNGQPNSGLECSVGFGISVPNQNTSLCNGTYGFYQGDSNAQYNYFASKVGIGTPFPTQALTVQGNVQVNGNLSVTGTTGQPLSLAAGGGQPINLTATTGTGNGGAVTIAAGSAGVSGGGSGGNLNLSAGNAMAQGGSGYANLGPAGNVNITAGSGYNNVGGNVILTSGGNSPWTQASNSFSRVSLQGGIINSGDGATIDVEGGHNTQYGSPPQYSAGGNIKLTAGNATGSFTGGNIVLQPGTGTPAGIIQANGDFTVTGRIGQGAAPKAEAYFNLNGTYTAPTYTAHLLQVDGTVKSNGGYAQAYLRGISVSPTFDVSAGYANYLVGIEADVRNKTGGNVAHSVVGFNLNGQPTSGQECSVGFGIGVPNQNTSLCNGKYGFYQGDTNAQYNYFASNVGIGTPFPTQALTVQGNTQISGNLSAGGTGAMPVYSSAGTAQNAPHMVTGTVAVNGSGTVTLSGAAVFSDTGSYTCTATSSYPAVGPVGVQNVSGSSFTLYGGFSGNVNYICVGN